MNAMCMNCEFDHTTHSSNCPKFKEARGTLEIGTNEKLSFLEAKIF